MKDLSISDLINKVREHARWVVETAAQHHGIMIQTIIVRDNHSATLFLFSSYGRFNLTFPDPAGNDDLAEARLEYAIREMVATQSAIAQK